MAATIPVGDVSIMISLLGLALNPCLLELKSASSAEVGADVGPGKEDSLALLSCAVLRPKSLRRIFIWPPLTFMYAGQNYTPWRAKRESHTTIAFAFVV
jgi:hypothetical protein